MQNQISTQVIKEWQNWSKTDFRAITSPLLDRSTLALLKKMQFQGNPISLKLRLINRRETFEDIDCQRLTFEITKLAIQYFGENDCLFVFF